jgi:protein SCO1
MFCHARFEVMTYAAAPWRRLAAVGVLLIVFHGCTPATTPPREYELQGQILAVEPDTREVRIKHSDIRGFMPGMTMTFPVRDLSLLRDKAPGDLVNARLVVSDTEAWLAVLNKTGSAPLPDESAETPSGVTLLTPGDPVPHTALIGDRGDAVSLAAWRGSAVAVTFIYTRCPLPQFCPLMDQRFAELQRLANEDRELSGRVRLLSVSFDPDADRPDVLGAHARARGADPAMWRFATADRAAIDRFAGAFGVHVRRESDGTITHNLRTAVVGPDGRLASVYDRSAWTVAGLANDMRKALASR